MFFLLLHSYVIECFLVNCSVINDREVLNGWFLWYFKIGIIEYISFSLLHQLNNAVCYKHLDATQKWRSCNTKVLFLDFFFSKIFWIENLHLCFLKDIWLTIYFCMVKLCRIFGSALKYLVYKLRWRQCYLFNYIQLNLKWAPPTPSLLMLFVLPKFSGVQTRDYKLATATWPSQRTNKVTNSLSLIKSLFSPKKKKKKKISFRSHDIPPDPTWMVNPSLCPVTLISVSHQVSALAILHDKTLNLLLREAFRLLSINNLAPMLIMLWVIALFTN